MRKICLRCGSKFGSRAEYCPHDGSLLVTDDELADTLLGTVLLASEGINGTIAGPAEDIDRFFETHGDRIENAHFYPILKTKGQKESHVAANDDEC